MRLFHKMFIVFAVFISLAGIAFADYTGLLFDWRPFVAKNYLELNQLGNNMLPGNLSAYQEIRGQFHGIAELLHGDAKTINDSSEVNNKKSVLSNIKVTFSPVNTFLLPSDESYLRGKDGKLSQASRTVPYFFRNPSQETAVETLKLIEPQINLGFEF